VNAGPLNFEIPALETLQVAALAITGLGCLLIFALKWSVLRTLGICALAGIGVQLIGSTL